MITFFYHFNREITYHTGNTDWPHLPSDMNIESTHSLVMLLLGHSVSEDLICKSTPKVVEQNVSFLVNTENVNNIEDLKCDDDGSWMNNGVRKVFLSIKHPASPTNLSTTVIQRGGKVPNVDHWCLTRTYFVLKDSKDFKKVIVSLQGQLLLLLLLFIMTS